MPTLASPRRPPRAQVIESILDAAVSLFAARGYEATTMQDVAAKVRMTAPALYYYFDSKQRLLFEVVEHNLRQFNAEIASAVAEATSPADRLRAYVRRHVLFQLQRAEPARLYNAMFLGTSALVNVLTARQRAAIRVLQDRSGDQLRAILHDGAAAGAFVWRDRTVLEHSLMAMGEQAPAWYRAGGPLTPDDVADEIATLALRMVAPTAPVRPPTSRRKSAS